MYAVIAVFNSLSVCGRSRYTADFAAPLRAERLSEHSVVTQTRSGGLFLKRTMFVFKLLCIIINFRYEILLYGHTDDYSQF